MTPSRCRDISRVWRAGGFNQQEMHFLVRRGPMLYTFGNDEQLAWSECYITVSHLNSEAALEDQKKIVGVVVLMPNELALYLYDHDVVAIKLRHGSRLPVVGEEGEFGGEIDRVAYGAQSLNYTVSTGTVKRKQAPACSVDGTNSNVPVS